MHPRPGRYPPTFIRDRTAARRAAYACIQEVTREHPRVRSRWLVTEDAWWAGWAVEKIARDGHTGDYTFVLRAGHVAISYKWRAYTDVLRMTFTVDVRGSVRVDECSATREVAQRRRDGGGTLAVVRHRGDNPFRRFGRIVAAAG